MKHSFKEWFAVTRYWSFPVSSMPVVVTFAWLFSRGEIAGGFRPYLILILSVLGVVLLHAAGNVLSDMFDYKSGVDNENAFAVPNLVFKKFEPREYLAFSIILFILGIAVGLVLAMLCGTGLLVIGAAGVLLTLLYSFLKYHALGDLDIFIIFGILTVLGTAYALTGEFRPDALLLAIPLGVITVSVLHANNTYDTETDRAAGIKTFGMLIGLKASAILYCTYMVIPFLCIIAYVAAGLMHPLALLCLLAAIPAFKNLKKAATYKTAGLEAMAGLDQCSAKLHMAFSLLLSAGLIVAGLI